MKKILSRKGLTVATLPLLAYSSSALAGVDLPSPNPDLVQNIVLIILSILQLFKKKPQQGQ